MMNSRTLVISIICLLIGFAAAYFIFHTPPASNNVQTAVIHAEKQLSEEDNTISSPFSPVESQARDNSRLTALEHEISQIKQQLQKLQLDLQQINITKDTVSTGTRQASASNRNVSLLSRRFYNYENLIKGGIESAIAEDIARRKNAIELKRLELQDRATRGGYLDTQRYYDELDDINSQQVNLRDELGDELYD